MAFARRTMAELDERSGARKHSVRTQAIGKTGVGIKLRAWVI
jgi:hypothetical protein